MMVREMASKARSDVLCCMGRRVASNRNFPSFCLGFRFAVASDADEASPSGRPPPEYGPARQLEPMRQ